MTLTIRIAVILLLAIPATGRGEDGAVVPMVRVEWGQYDPYNTLCPKVEENNTAAGCVALAAAQMLTHHRSPASLKGEIYYTTPTYGIRIYEDLEGRNIDWTMLDADTQSDAYRQWAAQIVYLAGIMAQTDYCPETSTAAMGQLATGLKDHCGFDTDMTIPKRECHTAEEWHDIVCNELRHGRPVIMSAKDTGAGAHAFVIDGMKPDTENPNLTLFHINWGWDGRHNGYFSLEHLAPGDYNFSAEQRIITHCQPDDGQTDVACCVEGSATLSKTSVSAGDTGDITLQLTFDNRCCRIFDGSFTATLIDEEGKKTSVGKKTYIRNITPFHSTRATVTFTPPAAAGRYTLRVTVSPLGSFTDYPASLTGDTTLTVTAPAGISPAYNDTLPHPDAIYNTGGQHLAKPRKGIIIINGRKVIY